MFVCSKCHADRCDDLFHSGKRVKVCKVCIGWKDHKSKGGVDDFVCFERNYFERRNRAWIAQISLKNCGRCGKIKSFLEFQFFSTAKLHDNYCKSCRINLKSIRRKVAGRENWNRPKQKIAHVMTWRAIHKKKKHHFDQHIKHYRRWQQNATMQERGDHWIKNEMPWRDPRLSDGEAYRLRYSLDIEFATKERMRRQLNKAKNKNGIAELIRGAVRRNGKSNTVERELGYSIAQLRRHLQSKFTGSMTWAAFADGQIHIDHIKPQSSFDLSDPVQWRECWSLENLQPLWASDNLKKGAKLDFIL